MHQEQLKKRLVKISASRPINTTTPTDFHRRENNFVSFEVDEEKSYSSFFEFEEKDDVDNFKPANSLIPKFNENEITNVVPSIVEFEIEKEVKVQSFVAFEPLDEKDINKDSSNIKASFIQCSYVKPDGVQCKRQAPNDGKFCQVHRKLLEK